MSTNHDPCWRALHLVKRTLTGSLLKPTREITLRHVQRRDSWYSFVPLTTLHERRDKRRHPYVYCPSSNRSSAACLRRDAVPRKVCRRRQRHLPQGESRRNACRRRRRPISAETHLDPSPFSDVMSPFRSSTRVDAQREKESRRGGVANA